MTALEIELAHATKEFGEDLLTKEGRINCIRKYGYHIWNLAKENYEYYLVEHSTQEQREKEFQRFLDTVDDSKQSSWLNKK